MTKLELIKGIQGNTLNKFSQEEVKDVISAFEKTVIDAVCAGEKVALAGFVSFEGKDTDARIGHNPATGEEIQIPASRKVAVKVGKNFKEAVKASV